MPTRITRRTRRFTLATAFALGLSGLAPSGAVIAAPEGEEKKPIQVLITNVDVWDGTSNTVMKDHDVLIEGNKIKDVAKGIKASHATVIDGKGAG